MSGACSGGCSVSILATLRRKCNKPSLFLGEFSRQTLALDSVGVLNLNNKKHIVNETTGLLVEF